MSTRAGAETMALGPNDEETVMTSLLDRPNTALLVIDVQNDVVADTHQRDEVIANIKTLVGNARAREVPVVWVQHADDNIVEGSEGWDYVPELSRDESEPVVHKHHGDSFEDTTLETELADRASAALRHRRPDRCVHPGDPPRRLRPRLRHPPRRGRAHHRGLLRVRPAAGRQGHRPHQHVLDLADRLPAARPVSSTPPTSTSAEVEAFAEPGSRNCAVQLRDPQLNSATSTGLCALRG